MSLIPDTPGARPAQVPVYRIDTADVEAAFQAFAMLQKVMADDPSLAGNRFFTALQDTAYARFLMTFEAL